MGLVVGSGGPARVRAHYLRPVVDSQGNLLLDVVVRVLQPGTTTVIPDTIYADSSSSTARTNPWTASNGVIDFYLDAAQRVRLGVKNGVQPEVFFDDIDVLTPTAQATTEMSLQDSGGVTWYITVTPDGHLATSTTP